MWRLECYPSGEHKKDEGYIAIFLQLCYLPPNVEQFNIQYKLKCEQTNDEFCRTKDFSFVIQVGVKINLFCMTNY